MTAELEHVTGEWLKIELFQYSKSVNARGVVSNLLFLDTDQRDRGETAISAGKHATAVECAAARFGIHTKLVMQASAIRTGTRLGRAWA